MQKLYRKLKFFRKSSWVFKNIIELTYYFFGVFPCTLLLETRALRNGLITFFTLEKRMLSADAYLRVILSSAAIFCIDRIVWFPSSSVHQKIIYQLAAQIKIRLIQIFNFLTKRNLERVLRCKMKVSGKKWDVKKRPKKCLFLALSSN